MINSKTDGILGRAFVNFGNSINLREYLIQNGVPSVSYENIDEISLKLSEKLYEMQ